MMTSECTSRELLIYTISRLLAGVRHVAVGMSSPMPAAGAMLLRALNKKHSKEDVQLSILGSIAHNAFTSGAEELFDCAAQGRIDAFFLGGGQIDGKGNVNLVGAGGYPSSQVRWPGSYGSAYLYFLVPSGAFLTLPMQEFAARFAVRGVELLGIPVYSNGLDIEVPGARFTVAEACAGLRFLIASVALGTLYGYTMYRSWQRRAAFIVVSIIVPIIANGMRVMGIVVYGYILGNAEAAIADHLIYGWVFFSIVSIILILLGLPFRQDVPIFVIPDTEAAGRRGQPTRIAAVTAVSAAFVALLASPIVTEGAIGAAMGSAVTGFKHMLGR